MSKTLEKLKAICADYKCEMETYYDAYWQEWNLIFHAPDKMQWNSTDSTAVVWNGPLRGVVSFLRSELECGFRKASELQLHWTDQDD